MRKYQSDRPVIPANIRREIEVEAGHKCSVTTCHEHTYLEIHHINGNREDNRKENLILLCGKHHTMTHAGVIDAKDLRSYKGIIRSQLTGNNFDRGVEGDRVLRFCNSIANILSYNDCGEVSWVGFETGYWFEQYVYIKLIDFFSNIQTYNMGLRSYDVNARNTQDRIVFLLEQLLNIRNSGKYEYNGGYCARFKPKNIPGSLEYDSEIFTQKKTVADILVEIQKLMFELWEYTENRSV